MRKSLSVIMTFAALLGTGLPGGVADGDDARAELIAALKEDPVIRCAINQLRSNLRASEGEQYEFVGLGGSCGVAGCDSKTLAVVSLHRRGVNPQSGTILATIDRHNAKLGRVTLVELKAKDDARRLRK